MLEYPSKYEGIIDFISDYKLKKSLPVWGKFRKLQKVFGVFYYYNNKEIKNYLRMYNTEDEVRNKLNSYDSYFNNVLEYLKVLKPSKSIEDQERFKILKEDFRKTYKEIHIYAEKVENKKRDKVISEFEREKDLLKK
ncbi:hypothetical protein [Lysinibacillus sphaericus]|uniref:hypothetical protein n=1 Tax=Lysinibacillus sphaericus TaxID=1421 RepID=UPI000C18D40F|nr:hypothetical protein [Lysinibacillus sphaericus]PIJ98121.1 hypothetical protein CTN02_10290 [Lysinibacillus sphaericus]